MKRKAIILAVALVAAGSLALLAQYATKVYFGPNGDTFVAASGGKIDVQSGATLEVDSGATFTISGSSFAPSSYAPLAGAAFTGPVSVTTLAANAFTVTTDTGEGAAVAFSIDGAAVQIGDSSNTTISANGSAVNFDATTQGQLLTSSAPSLTWDGAFVSSLKAFGIPANATLPTCDSTIGSTTNWGLYIDTTGPSLCGCNGTSWAGIPSGTCA